MPFHCNISNDMFGEDFTPLSPINFFQIIVSCHSIENGKFPQLTLKNAQQFVLPDTSSLCNERHFADVALGWNLEGIAAWVKVHQPFQECHYPDLTQGDSVELCIDTRDVKTSGYNTRFCHHFFFLPEAVDGHQAAEITHF